MEATAESDSILLKIRLTRDEAEANIKILRDNGGIPLATVMQAVQRRAVARGVRATGRIGIRGGNQWRKKHE
jgi:hypothetical protein